MAYDRYDREDRRWQDERSDRDWRGQNRDRHPDDHRHSGDDRGFFERAGEQISSWFGGMSDDDRSRDRGRDDRFDRERNRERSQDRDYGRSNDRERGLSDDRGLFNRGGSTDRDYGREPRSNMWGSRDHRSQERNFNDRNWDRHDDQSRGSGGYRPMTGDYGRGTERGRGQFFEGSTGARNQRSYGGDDREQDRRLREFHRESDRSEGPWSRDDYRRTSFAGSSKNDRDFDPNYHDWRDRHMSEVDADYHDYRRERQSRFEDDFSGWRSKRQEKRGLLGQIREHMDVVGNDGEHVGTVDKVAGDRLILTKSDPASGGRHHSLTCSAIDRVEGNRIILDSSARDARNRWRDEDRSRALFERHEQGEDGPGVLNRSFSGTYRDR